MLSGNRVAWPAFAVLIATGIRSRTTAGLAAWGAVTPVGAVGALFVDVLLAG